MTAFERLLSVSLVKEAVTHGTGVPTSVLGPKAPAPTASWDHKTLGSNQSGGPQPTASPVVAPNKRFQQLNPGSLPPAPNRPVTTPSNAPYPGVKPPAPVSPAAKPAPISMPPNMGDATGANGTGIPAPKPPAAVTTGPAAPTGAPTSLNTGTPDTQGSFSGQLATPKPAPASYTPQQLQAFQKSTGTAFNAKSKMDIANMDRMSGGQSTMDAKQYRAGLATPQSVPAGPSQMSLATQPPALPATGGLPAQAVPATGAAPPPQVASQSPAAPVNAIAQSAGMNRSDAGQAPTASPAIAEQTGAPVAPAIRPAPVQGADWQSKLKPTTGLNVGQAPKTYNDLPTTNPNGSPAINAANLPSIAAQQIRGGDNVTNAIRRRDAADAAKLKADTTLPTRPDGSSYGTVSTRQGTPGQGGGTVRNDTGQMVPIGAETARIGAPHNAAIDRRDRAATEQAEYMRGNITDAKRTNRAQSYGGLVSKYQSIGKTYGGTYKGGHALHPGENLLQGPMSSSNRLLAVMLAKEAVAAIPSGLAFAGGALSGGNGKFTGGMKNTIAQPAVAPGVPNNVNVMNDLKTSAVAPAAPNPQSEEAAKFERRRRLLALILPTLGLGAYGGLLGGIAGSQSDKGLQGALIGGGIGATTGALAGGANVLGSDFMGIDPVTHTQKHTKASSRLEAVKCAQVLHDIAPEYFEEEKKAWGSLVRAATPWMLKGLSGAGRMARGLGGGMRRGTGNPLSWLARGGAAAENQLTRLDPARAARLTARYNQVRGNATLAQRNGKSVFATKAPAAMQSRASGGAAGRGRVSPPPLPATPSPAGAAAKQPGLMRRGANAIYGFGKRHPVISSIGGGLGAQMGLGALQEGSNKQEGAELAMAQMYQQYAAMPWYQRLMMGMNPESMLDQMPQQVIQQIRQQGNRSSY